VLQCGDAESKRNVLRQILNVLMDGAARSRLSVWSPRGCPIQWCCLCFCSCCPDIGQTCKTRVYCIM